MNNNKQSIVNKEFVPYKESLELGQLGFDEFCFAWYVSENYGLEFGSVVKDELIRDAVLAPTFSQAFRFFRGKGLDQKIERESEGLYIGFYWNGVAWNQVGEGTYEEAEFACLKKLIEIQKGLESQP